LAQNVDMLAEEVDSLRAELKAVTSDPVRLERMAREEWGMVRGEKELLYRMRTDTSRAP
jgi:cell division protein FtsB